MLAASASLGLFTGALSSVSADAEHRKDVIAMGEYLKKQLEDLGVEVRMADVGKQVIEGVELPLPPVILGRFGSDPKKKTVQLYAHYDVQPVCPYLSRMKGAF